MKQLGLTESEAQTLLGKYGTNELHQTVHSSKLFMFLDQFKSPLVVILCIATFLSFLLGDVVESILILCIVVANAILGFAQENKAENAIAALKQMTITLTRVLRNGTVIELDSRQIVPGDIMYIEEGNKIPADATLLEALHFEVNESSLTGESMPVEKNAQGKEHSQIYMGTIAARGRATALVTSTGMNTSFGKIAQHLATIKKEETPLEKKLAAVAKQIGLIAILAAAIIFGIGIYHSEPLLELILTGISLGVAAVPEGLPAVITITLALGMQRMAAKRAILRKLSAIEAIGGITVIATDKTGTLTKNQMRVTQYWFPNSAFTIKDTPKASFKLLSDLFIRTCIYCNNATLSPANSPDSYEIIGDQTEGALLLFAQQQHIDVKKVKTLSTLIDEHAFDAVTKTMSVIVKDHTGTHVYSKGAPESILERSTHIHTASGVRAITEKDKDTIITEYEQFAKQGLRTIALGVKKVQGPLSSRHSVESKLTFIGFAGIADPPREEIPHAISMAKAAGIQTIMITGDNELTAYAIAKQIGLVDKGDEVVTGSQLSHMSEDELKRKLAHIRVFARTTPEQKLYIVKTLQSLGHVVSVTGDGVNDALALKQADVGVAMGKAGTDVAKEASDMIITDDNYATLVTAVEEGRGIYDNMKSSIKYLIGCNIGEILGILGGTIIGWPLILTPLQILYMNLATDGLQAIALAMNPKSSTIMKRKPIKAGELFSRKDAIWFLETSIATAACTLIAFWIGNTAGGVVLGRTLAFVAIVLCQQWVYLDISSMDQTIISGSIWKNPWMLLPVCVFISQIAFPYIPFIQGMFKLSPPNVGTIVQVIIITSGIIVVSELRKFATKIS